MNDDELFDALARSLRAPDAEPSPAELVTFHDALAGRAETSNVGAGAAAPMPPNQRPSAPRRSRTPK